jgi:hypothetical protein
MPRVLPPATLDEEELEVAYWMSRWMSRVTFLDVG